jgi:hypothetical protein
MSQKYAHLDADRFVIGFYDENWHGDSIPSDAVPIDDAHHVALLEGQSAGKRMKLCEKGLPLLVDPPAPSDDDLAALLRAQRDAALGATDWLVQRHMDESVFSKKTTLTVEQVQALGEYRAALRDLPAADGFPHVDLPAAPDFVGGEE